MSTFITCRRDGCSCGALSTCHAGCLSATVPRVFTNDDMPRSGSGKNCSSTATHYGFFKHVGCKCGSGCLTRMALHCSNSVGFTPNRH